MKITRQTTSKMAYETIGMDEISTKKGYEKRLQGLVNSNFKGQVEMRCLQAILKRKE